MYSTFTCTRMQYARSKCKYLLPILTRTCHKVGAKYRLIYRSVNQLERNAGKMESTNTHIYTSFVFECMQDATKMHCAQTQAGA